MIGTVNNAIRYDQANRMTSATVGGTASVYTYDALGNRVSEKVGTATTTNFTWDPNAAAAELAQTVKGSTTNTYFYGDRLEAMKSGSTTSYDQLDQTGSVSTVISEYLDRIGWVIYAVRR